MLPKPGDYESGVNGLTLYWREETTAPEGEGYAAPHATVVLQGAERVLVNGREYTCGQCQCRLTRQEIHGTGHIVAASPEEPFFAMSLALDSSLLTEFSEILPGVDGDSGDGVAIRETDEKVLHAFHRLALLLGQPERIQVFSTLLIYEIHYLLAVGPGCAPSLQ